MNSLKATKIILWNIVGALLKLKGITIYWKKPHSVRKVVLCRPSLAILICWYPKNPSMNEKNSWTPTLSRMSFVNGVGNGLYRHTSFNFLKLKKIHISSVFLSWKTIGLIHFDSSTCSILLASIILSCFSLTFSLEFRFSLYVLYFTDLAYGFNGIFFSPRSPTMPFIL